MFIGHNNYCAEREYESFQAKLSKISKNTKFKNIMVQGQGKKNKSQLLLLMYNMGIKIAFFCKAENAQHCRLSGKAFIFCGFNIFSVVCC